MFEMETSYTFWSFVTTHQQNPLFQQPILAEIVVRYITEDLATQVQQLWGYVVLPDGLQVVVEVDTEQLYHECIETLKAQTQVLLYPFIEKNFPTLLDSITFYHPLWHKPIYQVWQAGYHTQPLASPYAISNKVAEMVNKPVELGLAKTSSAWRYSSFFQAPHEEVE